MNTLEVLRYTLLNYPEEWDKINEMIIIFSKYLENEILNYSSWGELRTIDKIKWGLI